VGDVHQIGQKPGTAGHPLPGVALRVLDEAGRILGPEQPGRLQALVAGRAGWAETGLRASLDPDGFVRLDPSLGEPQGR
jgi:acyl-coenzyme A synthetase/AMP-(fatty) acid ligase